jgi:opacity protein-like surface antigen
MCRLIGGLLLSLTFGSSAAGQSIGDIDSQQHRQPVPIEAFFLVGGYYAGAIIEPQRSELPRQMRPQIGGAVQIPVRNHWAVLIDATTSMMTANWKWDGERPAGPDDNVARVRRVTVLPAAVRVWRFDNFSMYAGGGFGVEWQSEFTRYKAIVGRLNLRPVVANVFTEERLRTRFLLPIGFRAGVTVSPRARLALRVGYSYGRRYLDFPAAHGLDVGVGYRFARGV